MLGCGLDSNGSGEGSTGSIKAGN